MALVRKKEAGEIFAALRVEMGYSQEKMAEMCECSRSLIQKIESGEAISEEKFDSFMNLLGVTDIDYEDLYINETVEKIRLKHEIITMLLIGNGSAAEKRIERYKEICGFVDTDKRKLVMKRDNELFIHFTESMVLVIEGYEQIMSLEDWIDMIHITIPEYHFGDRIERPRLSKTELLVFNAYALWLMWEKEYDRASFVFNDMSEKTMKGRIMGFEYTRAASAVSVNLALCLIYLDKTFAAQELLRYAMKGYMSAGGGYLWLELMRAQLLLYEKEERLPEHDRMERDLKAAYRSMSVLYKSDLSFEEFLKRRPGIIIL